MGVSTAPSSDYFGLEASAGCWMNKMSVESEDEVSARPSAHTNEAAASRGNRFGGGNGLKKIGGKDGGDF